MKTDVERACDEAEQTIDRAEAAMISERKQQYGPDFKPSQEADIKTSHRLMRQGVGIARAALASKGGE